MRLPGWFEARARLADELRDLTQCEQLRADCDKAKALVEANDGELEKMTAEEQRLKIAYVDSKLTYEKAHAAKWSKQQELKALREQKGALRKELTGMGNATKAARTEQARAHGEHVRAEESAAALAAKLEAVEKDKDLQLRRLQQHRDEVARLRQLEMQLKQELDVVAASADTRRR